MNMRALKEKKDKPASSVPTATVTIPVNPRTETADFDLNPILDESFFLAYGVLKNFLNPLHQCARQKITGLVEINSRLHQRLSELTQNDFSPATFCRELEAATKEYLQWLEAGPFLDDAEFARDLLNPLDQEFQQLCQKLPAFVTITVADEFWQPASGDPLLIRWWKRGVALRLSFQRFAYKIANRIRALLRRPEQTAPPRQRNIAAQPFLKFHLELPLATFLLEERQRNLRGLAEQVHQIHQGTESMMFDLLFLDDLKELYLNPPPEKVAPKLQSLKNQIQNLQADLENINVSESEKRLQEFLDDAHRSLRLHWERAGTVVLPNQRFGDLKVAKGWRSLEQDFNEAQKSWAQHFEGEKHDWQKDLQLSELQLRATQICFDTLGAMVKKIRQQILPEFERLHNLLAASLERFQKIEQPSDSELERAILDENRSLVRDLRREHLPHISEIILQAKLVKAVENCGSRIGHTIESLPDRHRIFRSVDLKGLRPKSNVVEIALKDLVLSETYSKLEKEHAAFASEIQQKVDKIVRDISEIDQIIEVNLEAALELLQEESSETQAEAHSVALQGVQRAKNQIISLIQQIEEIAAQSEETLLKLALDFEKQIKVLADNEKILDLKLRVARARSREQVRDYRRQILKSLKLALPTLRAEGSELFKKIRDSYFRIRKITGLAHATVDAEAKLIQFVSETQRRINRLPYVYQRLFRIEPLTDERFFGGRAEDLEYLKNAFAAWRAGEYGVTAIVGEKGSGKTTLLNFATSEIYSKLPLQKIELAGLAVSDEKKLFLLLKDALHFDDAANLDDLERRLINLENQKIIVVEDLQNLFIRTVDGFDALERFLSLISRTHRSVYWVATCTRYSWRYLDRVLNVSKFFQHVISLGSLTQEDIENIILKRHRVSGYKLVFEPPPEASQSKKFKKLASEAARQDFLQDLYFGQLNQLAAGNITIAMMFWQSAIQKIAQESMQISLKNFDASFLHQLPAEELFTLAALLQHEMLRIEEHATIFHQDIQQSTLLMNRMANRGILYEKSNGCFQINFLLYRAVVQTLAAKNILH